MMAGVSWSLETEPSFSNRIRQPGAALMHESVICLPTIHSRGFKSLTCG